MLKWIAWPMAAALAFAPLGAAAAPAVSGAAPAVGGALGTGIAHVQYRRGGFGGGLGVGLGIGVWGAIIANEAYRPRAGYYYDDYAYDAPTTSPRALPVTRATCVPSASVPSSGPRGSTR